MSTPSSGNSAKHPVAESDEELFAACRVDTFRSGGKGGQHQNVTESGVRLTHLPTGIVVLSRSERSQHRNRALALERLRKKLAAHRQKPKRRVPTRAPRAAKERRLEEKRRSSRTKELRRPPDSDG
jgi:protein subunit release factor A